MLACLAWVKTGYALTAHVTSVCACIMVVLHMFFSFALSVIYPLSVSSESTISGIYVFRSDYLATLTGASAVYSYFLYSRVLLC